MKVLVADLSSGKFEGTDLESFLNSILKIYKISKNNYVATRRFRLINGEKNPEMVSIKNKYFFGELISNNYMSPRNEYVRIDQASHYFKSFFLDEKKRKLYGDLYFLENEIGLKAKNLFEQGLTKFYLRGYGTYDKVVEILSFDIDYKP